MKLSKITFFIAASLIVSACSTSGKVKEQTENPTVSHVSNHTTQATLWVQNAAEYKALATQAYVTALRSLPLAKEDSYWTALLEQEEQEETEYSRLPPAIILDVDETVLDNSPFQARMIKEGKTYNIEDWNKWVNEANAEAVPGAVEFTQYASDRGIEIFFVTNREHVVEDATRKNLADLGFPISGSLDNILTKGERENWTSAKTERKKFLSRHYRILMLFGDDLNDFLPAKNISEEERIALVNDHSEYFGRRWFILPNPVYGSWEQAMFGFDYNLTDEERENIQSGHLNTGQRN